MFCVVDLEKGFRAQDRGSRLSMLCFGLQEVIIGLIYSLKKNSTSTSTTSLIRYLTTNFICYHYYHYSAAI